MVIFWVLNMSLFYQLLQGLCYYWLRNKIISKLLLISNFSNYCYNLCKEEILFDIKFFYECLEIEFILKMLEIFNKYVNFVS